MNSPSFITIILLLFLTHSFYSCVESKSYELANTSGLELPNLLISSDFRECTTTAPLTLNFEIVKDKTKFSDLFDIDELIFLDSKYFIGQIDKILSVDSSLVIVDREIGERVHIYNSKGRNQYSIDSKGIGPGTYKTINDVFIDEKEKSLYVLDNYKLLEFDLRGNFIREEKMSIPCSSGMILDSLLITSSDFNTIASLDHNFSLISYRFRDSLALISLNRKYPLENIEISYGLYDYLFPGKERSAYLIETFNDTIYKIQNNIIKANYVTDFNTLKLPQADKSPTLFNTKRWQSDKLWGASRILEIENNIIIEARSGKEIYIGFSNTKTGESLLIEVNKMLNDYFLFSSMIPISVLNGRVLFAVLPSEIHYALSQLPKEEFYNNLKEKQIDPFWIKKIAEETTPNSNPVLVSMKLKSSIYD